MFFPKEDLFQLVEQIVLVLTVDEKQLRRRHVHCLEMSCGLVRLVRPEMRGQLPVRHHIQISLQTQ
jgi:hypothetical protein